MRWGRVARQMLGVISARAECNSAVAFATILRGQRVMHHHRRRPNQTSQRTRLSGGLVVFCAVRRSKPPENGAAFMISGSALLICRTRQNEMGDDITRDG